jgi:TonB-linked SusC/RagA family outer membrane protein
MKIIDLKKFIEGLLKTLTIASLVCFGVALKAQNTVTGKASDASGALPGVSVTIKGTNVGALTGSDGTYSIKTPDGNATLVFSLMGFTAQEIAVGNKTVIDVVMVASAELLDDVIVVGYGTQRKVTATGAVAAITGEELTKTKTGNVQTALVGRITGVKVNQRTSQPGTFNADFNIRGMGTPLVVVDGVPRDNMTRLDDREIESISVLKDASAAVYGSRAANGVVLITTKKGRADKKFSFEYNGYVGIQNMMLNVELMDAVQYMQIYNEKDANSNRALRYSEEEIKAYMNGTKQSTDWLGAIIKKNPLQHQHSLSASGSTGKIDYFVNFGHFHQDGWFNTDNLYYKRFNLRSNVSAQITDNLRAEVLINLISDIRHQQPENTWRVINRGAYLIPPTTPIYLNGDPNYPILPPVGDNIVTLVDPKNGYNYNKERAINTNIVLEYKLPWVEGLSVKGMYSYDYTEDEWKIFRKGFNRYAENGTVSYNSYSPMNRVWWGGINTLLQLSTNFNRTFGDHTVSGTLVYEESDREADNFWVERNTILLDQIFAGNADGQKGDQYYAGMYNPREDANNALKEALYHYANKGLIGKFSYSYRSKYMLDFDFRYDGSSRFGPGHQWGFFPVVSAGWRISEEGFFKSTEMLDFVNNMKIRGSIGQMGDEGTSTYQFMTGYNYGPSTILFGSARPNMATPRGIPNPLITWSTSTVADIGVDIDLWRGKLGIVADIYQRKRTGLLATRATSLPGVVGANMPQENLNSDLTRGFELALSHRNRIKDFSYNASAGVFMSRTKNLHIEEAGALDAYDKWRSKYTDRYGDIIWGVNQTGQYQSFDEIFGSGLVYDGQGNSYMLPGDFIYEDWNGDGIIDGADEHPIAINTNIGEGVKPLLNYHFSIGAEWKGFDLNLLFQGAAMAWRSYATTRDNRSDQYRGVGYRDANGFTLWYDRWHRADETNPSKWQEWVPGKYPSVYQDISQRNDIITRMSDFWAWNTAYFRLKSIELGYTLPASLTSKVGIESLRIFFNSFNTFTLSGMPIGDPEVRDGDEYPLNKTFSFGINLKF